MSNDEYDARMEQRGLCTTSAVRGSVFRALTRLRSVVGQFITFRISVMRTRPDVLSYCTAETPVVANAALQVEVF